jgi:hypothetical protein
VKKFPAIFGTRTFIDDDDDDDDDNNNNNNNPYPEPDKSSPHIPTAFP